MLRQARRLAALAALLSLALGAAAQQQQVVWCGSCMFWLDGEPGVNATLSTRGARAEDCFEVWLYGYGIVRIADRTFTGMPALRTLQLGNNSITEVHPESFWYHTALQTLLLDENGMTEVHPEKLRYNTALQVLKLRNNSIVEMHPEMFQYNTVLQELRLDYNSIAEVHPETFRYNTALKRLDLDRNSIAKVHLENFWYNTALQVSPEYLPPCRCFADWALPPSLPK